jgi:competence protein ComEA
MNVIRSILMAMALFLSAFAYAGPVNINTADAAAIAEAMNGVGIKKAQAIVDYRSKNGAFKSLDDLALVKGIGDKTVMKNRANLVIEPQATGK